MPDFLDHVRNNSVDRRLKDLLPVLRKMATSDDVESLAAGSVCTAIDRLLAVITKSELLEDIKRATDRLNYLKRQLAIADGASAE